MSQDSQDHDQITPSERRFEDLTLAELVGQLMRAPRRTLAALLAVASAPVYKPTTYTTPAAPPPPTITPSGIPASASPSPASMSRQHILKTARGLFLMAGLALCFAGNLAYFSPAPNGLLRDVSPLAGLPLIVVGMLLWLIAELAPAFKPEAAAPDTARTEDAQPAAEPLLPDRSRALLLVAGAGLSVPAYLLNGDNRFTALGALAWFAAIALTAYALTPPDWSLRAWLRTARDSLRRFPTEQAGTFLALIAITLFAAYFRLQDLPTMLPEMTSDHIEKLMDAQRVARGDFDVFFANNGGREPMQMYALALLSALPGIEVDFAGLKLLAVLESLLTIPVFWALGRALMGDDRRAQGNLLGLALAALLAVGYWHVALTRLSLRIILTPLFTALLLIFLTRALRYNRRVDFVAAGLVLGVSLYSYQAARMLPVVVLLGVGLAFVWTPLSARAFGTARLRYVVNLAVLVLVAFTVFVPLFRYSVQYPEDFWRRTSGRLLGDELITDTLPDGTLIQRVPTIEERLSAFTGNMSILGVNYLRALGMFNYRGDGLWFHNAPGYPALDPLTGALFLAGLAAWLALIWRTRDPALMLIPLALLVMLLPSALALANPNENPSHTRASGALPMTYALAAYGLVVLVGVARASVPRMPNRAAVLRLAVAITLALGVAYVYNADRVLRVYRDWYTASWKPLSDGGRFLRGFALSDGGYGNAFMLAYPHWWDYRIVGHEAGLPPGDWHNGNIPLDALPAAMAEAWSRSDNRLRLNPNRDLIVMFPYAPDQTEAQRIEAQLKDWFPEGSLRAFETYRRDVLFNVFRIPAPGEERLRKFLAEHHLDA